MSSVTSATTNTKNLILPQETAVIATQATRAMNLRGHPELALMAGPNQHLNIPVHKSHGQIEPHQMMNLTRLRTPHLKIALLESPKQVCTIASCTQHSAQEKARLRSWYLLVCVGTRHCISLRAHRVGQLKFGSWTRLWEPAITITRLPLFGKDL